MTLCGVSRLPGYVLASGVSGRSPSLSGYGNVFNADSSSTYRNVPQITVVVFTVVHPLSLVAAWLWVKLRGSRRGEGAIALPPDEDEAPQARRGPREVDAEALWG